MRRSLIQAVQAPPDEGPSWDREERSERARRAPRCPECHKFDHRPKPCPTHGGPEPLPISELIARGLVVEPNGCHSFNGLRTRNPQVKAKIPIRRYLMGLKQVRQVCGRAWCINRDHLRVVEKSSPETGTGAL
jgi:hypothetical protein